MNDREWLRSRRPSPPPKLFDRVELAVPSLSNESTMSRSETLAIAAVSILAPLVGPDAPEVSRSREVAIDLLSVDALVTYAIEAATEECEVFQQNIDRVIAQLASLARAGKV
jgi:hypothetical protein